MAKAKHVDKEKLKQVQEIEAQLRASANTASKLVSSWLPDNESDSEDNSGADGKKTATAAATLKPRDVFKGRPARLGVGAKFLSHKEMMANSQSGPGILSAEELSLKRKLTRGKPSAADDDKRLQLDKRKVAEEEDDDVDSRSHIVASSSSAKARHSSTLSPAPSRPGKGSHAAEGASTGKKSKTNLFLDSLIKRRKR